MQKTFINPISWEGNKVRIIDQTKLPEKLSYLYIGDLKILWKAIKTLQVRGAPALGAAASLGVYLGIKDSQARNFSTFTKELDRVIRYLGSSRPTARNLFWGLERMASIAIKNKYRNISAIKKIIFAEAQWK